VDSAHSHKLQALLLDNKQDSVEDLVVASEPQLEVLVELLKALVPLALLSLDSSSLKAKDLEEALEPNLLVDLVVLLSDRQISSLVRI
jgi:hypothetical protein